ncbi:phage head closure protein [Oxalobacteraceae bacterium A2-2]
MPKNRKVQLQHRGGVDGTGQPLDDTWNTFAHPWAEVRDVSGREFIAGDGMQSAVTTRIRIWRRTDVTAAMRVLAGAVAYEILAVLEEGADTTLLMCKRINQ